MIKLNFDDYTVCRGKVRHYRIVDKSKIRAMIFMCGKHALHCSKRLAKERSIPATYQGTGFNTYIWREAKLQFYNYSKYEEGKRCEFNAWDERSLLGI